MTDGPFTNFAGVVLVLVVIIASYLGMVDYLLSHIVRYLID